MRNSIRIFAVCIVVSVLLWGTWGWTQTPCELPNPKRAQVSTELWEPYEVLADGSFEDAATEVRTSSPFVSIPFDPPTATRSGDAAHSGSWGYQVQATAGQAGELTTKAFADKAEDIQVSVWVRCPGGSAQARIVVHFEDDDLLIDGPYFGPFVDITDSWTQLTYTAYSKQNFHQVWAGVTIGPGTTLYVDDVSVQPPIWKLAEVSGPSVTVGGIPVPQTPVAPTLLSFSIHLEDPQELVEEETFFRQKTAVFTRLAELFYNHGGRLNIQPELEWALGAQLFQPDTLQHLSEEYGVYYSTHTHGPICKDEDGTPMGAEICNRHAEWSREITPEDVVEYIQTRNETFSLMSGVPVMDHNGNFDLVFKNPLAAIGIRTLTCFKNPGLQRSYDYLINNPWRPTNVDALVDTETFLTHDPSGPLVYVPGVGTSFTKNHDRVPLAVSRIISQFIHFADADRVNALSLIFHVDSFLSQEGTPYDEYLAVDPVTHEVTYSDEFLIHLSYYEELLSTVVDPLVAAGYLQWSTIQEMGEAFVAWEDACDGGEVVTRIPSEVAGTEGLATRIVMPVEARYAAEGAPVVVYVPGGTTGGGLHNTGAQLNTEGFIEIFFNFPGSGREDEISGGTYDFRGPDSLKALRDVLRFAMGDLTDVDGHTLADLTGTIVPDYANAGITGWSNGGNATISVAGMHGDEISDLGWIVNWEFRWATACPTAEAGGRNSSFENPMTNSAYDPDTGVWDLSSLRYVEDVDIDGDAVEVLTGGLYFDLNGNESYDVGTDFLVNPYIFDLGDGKKAYYSNRIAQEAESLELYPDPAPSHLPTAAETAAFWYSRNAENWFTQAVTNIPNLMFIVEASAQDHVQTALDHPHVLIQYEGMRSAGARFVRVNPDRSYLEEIMGESQPDATDNDGFAIFDHMSIRDAVEPITVPTAMGVAAAACELADRTHANNIDPQITYEGEGVEEGEGEGVEEGEGSAEGVSEGAVEGEGMIEGSAEGVSEGAVEGEGVEEGEGSAEGVSEGAVEGEGMIEGSAEGVSEGAVEGEGVGEGEGSAEGVSEGSEEGEEEPEAHSADQNADGLISLSELLRVIQFYNSEGYHCDAMGEDGYSPDAGDTSCSPHASDYNPQDWHISLSELLRIIQFYNSGGYHACPGEDTEDSFCPGL